MKRKYAEKLIKKSTCRPMSISWTWKSVGYKSGLIFSLVCVLDKIIMKLSFKPKKILGKFFQYLLEFQALNPCFRPIRRRTSFYVEKTIQNWLEGEHGLRVL